MAPLNLVAIYPGSFDPITNGHLDLISRGSRLVGRLIVAVLRNDAKQPLFSVEERVEMLREVVGAYPNVEVSSFDGLAGELRGGARSELDPAGHPGHLGL